MLRYGTGGFLPISEVMARIRANHSKFTSAGGPPPPRGDALLAWIRRSQQFAPLKSLRRFRRAKCRFSKMVSTRYLVQQITRAQLNP